MTFRSGVIGIVGPPNVGKSTLLNRLMGRKIAAVSPRPQTTRKRILGVVNRKKVQMVFLDTPGIHEARTPLHKGMVASALATIGEADMVLLMVEAKAPQEESLSGILKNLQPIENPKILLINKIDLVARESLLPLLARFGSLGLFEEMIPISARTGDGMDSLLKALHPRLPEGPPLFPPEMDTDQTEPFFISEVIREKIFLYLKREVPYSSAVTVEKVEEQPEKDLLFVSARIHVESESQKKICIGKQGRMIKTLGQAARAELETLFGIRVYLDLTVRVEPGWSRDTRALRRLGY